MMRSNLPQARAGARRRLPAAVLLFACAGLAPPLAAAPVQQDPAAAEEATAPEGQEPAANEGGLRRLFRGMLRSRYIGRWTGSESDNDLVAILSLDVGDAEKHDYTAHLFGRVTYDMDGDDETFASINDSYGSDLDGLLYDAYVDAHRFEAFSLVRLGRQSVDEAPLLAWFDGAHVATSGLGEMDWQLGAYGGSSTHFYEASKRGDFVAGAYVQGRPWESGKLRLDYMFLEDETRLRTRDDDLFGAHVWQAFGERVRADVAYTRIADRDRDVRATAQYVDADGDLFVRASYYRLLRTQGDLVLEADPFYNALNELRPYDQGSLMAAKGIGDHLRLQAAADLRRVEDTADIGFYNRDYDHYSGTAQLFDFGIEGVAVSGTVDFWDSNAQIVKSWGADLDYECCEDSLISVGTYYSLYKYDLFTNIERDHVRTYFVRFRHQATDDVSIESDYELEDDDYDRYYRFRLGVTWRF